MGVLDRGNTGRSSDLLGFEFHTIYQDDYSFHVEQR